MQFLPSLRVTRSLASAMFTGVLLAVTGGSSQAQNTPTDPQASAAKASYVADELMVKIQGGAFRSTTAANAHARVGARLKRDFGFIGWQTVKLPKGMSLSEGIGRYKKLAGVVAVEPNYVVTGQALPNDPRLGDLYAMPKIGAPSAWNVTTGSATTVVAVIDSGVDYNHQDLAANMWKNPGEIAGNGKDDDANGFVDDVYGIDTLNNDSDPMDDNSHGTHCAGTIGGVGNNGIGVVGVNWNVKIMALKFLGATNGGTTDGAIRALQYVTMMKNRGINVRVINNSWGGGGFSQALKDALDASAAAGMLNVCAASNGGADGVGDNNDTTPIYPANFDTPALMSIAASDSSDNRGSFSNFGATTVDLAAPGVGIWSTIPGSGYGSKNGTSMATPCVAGAAALLVSYKPTLTPADLKTLLMNTVDVLPLWNGVVATGGRLNLARALRSINPNAPPAVDQMVPPSGTGVAVVKINFSKPMNRTTTAAALKFTPAIAGSIVWSNTDKTLTFTSGAALPAGNSYEVRVLGNASDTTGKTLDGNGNNLSEGTPNDDYIGAVASSGAPSNDMFANARVISNQTGSVTGFNTNATKETGEYTHTSWSNGQGGGIISAGKSVWYKWTAPITGTVSMQAQASFGPYLEVYEGTSVATLQSVTSSGTSSSTAKWRATIGKTYYIVVDSLSYMINYQVLPVETGAFTFVWQQLTPPVNDDFVKAIGITGATGSVTGSNLGSYYENGEPSHVAGSGTSVWYKWTPTAIGALTLDTEGSVFNTGISVYTGTSVSSLADVAEDDDSGSGTLSFVQFSVTPGKTYYIAVHGSGYGVDAEQGNFKLSWAFTPAPSNDMLAAAALVSASTGTVTGTNFGASVEASEPSHGSYSSGDSIWYRWVATGDGSASFDTIGSSFDTTMAVYTSTGTTVTSLQKVKENDDLSNQDVSSRVTWTVVSGRTYFIAIAGDKYGLYSNGHGPTKLNWKVTPAPSNDKFGAAQSITTNTGNLVATNFGANMETNEPDHYASQTSASVWYKWTATQDGSMSFDTRDSQINTTMAVYTGTSFTNFKSVASNDDVNYPNLTSKVTWTAVSGTTYYIAVATSSNYNDEGTGPYNLYWNFVLAPSNDKFAAAQSITTTTGRLAATNFGANMETGETDHGASQTSASVWYKWTASRNGSMSFDTSGSSINTTMAVYSGTSLSNLVQITYNDDVEYPNVSSAVTWTAVSGVTYYIAVSTSGDYNDAGTGPFNLNWNLVPAPANDMISAAQTITGPSGHVAGSNFAANFETSEPTHGYYYNTASVWYKWTAPGNGGITFDTADSELNTTMGVYLANSSPVVVSNLTELASNNDLEYPDLSSRVTIAVRAGQTYYIAVASGNLYDDPPTGPFNLNWLFTAAPSNDNFASAQIISGTSGRVTGSNVGASAELDEPYHNYNDASASIWYKWTAPAAGDVTITTLGSSFDTIMGAYSGTSFSNLSSEASNDDGNYPDVTSSVTFTVASGVTYYIAVDGAGYSQPEMGDVVLTWSLNGAVVRTPTISNFTPASGGAGTIVTVNGSNFTGTTAVKFNGVSGTFQIVSDTQLKATAPTGVSTGRIAVTTAYGTGTSLTNFLVAPRITSFTPTSGAAGASVVITGANFIEVNAVKFNGSAANYVVNSATQITANVPADATTGLITVSATSGTGTSATNFTVAPRITGFTPQRGGVSTVVTINGVNFSGATAVKFNATLATAFQVVSPTQINATVPAGATSGTITITTPAGSAVSAGSFTVVPAPSIASFTPTSGVAGTVVNISGSNFSEASEVRFNGVIAPGFQVVSATQIRVTAPTGATTGPIRVTTPGGSTTSAASFTYVVPPTIGSFTPTFGKPGTVVTITGTGFINASTTVNFGGVNATTVAFVSATQIKATVPTGAVTGPIGVTTTGGSARSAGTFLVDTSVPSVTLTTPANGATYTSLTSIAGTSVDNAGGSGMAKVDLQLKRDIDGVHWNGTAWGTTTPVTLTTTLQANGDWARSSGLPVAGTTDTTKLLTPGTYSIAVTAHDKAGNTRGALSSFRFQNGPPPSLSVSDVSVVEGVTNTTANAAFTVTLSSASLQTVTVNYATANGTTNPATAATDYTAVSGTLSFAPGQTSKTVTVPVLGDSLDELNETFNLQLASAVGAPITDATGQCTINDDDTSVITANAPAMTEGNSTTTNGILAFTVKLSNPNSRTVTVSAQTSNAATLPATVGTDYIALPPTTLTFAPGVTTQTVSVSVKCDVLDEDNEAIGLTLSSPVNATVGGNSQGTILDDDATPTVRINDVSIVEGNLGTKTALFTVTLSTVSGRNVTVNFATANGTATAGTDYVASTGTLTLAPGQTSGTIAITINGDAVLEASEQFQVNLTGSVGASILDGTGVGTITNDEPGIVGGAPSASAS